MPVDSQVSSSGKNVLITGASSGFGLTACEVFLKAGWTVFAAVRGGRTRSELFHQVAADFPGRFQLVELDLLQDETIRTLAAEFAEVPLHALINNAGYGLFGAVEDMAEENLRRQMEVNFFGTFRLTQALLPRLRESRGVIVSVSSIVGRHALPLTSGYCASKFALEGWMEAMAMELKPFGVSCYLIEPGTFPTRFGSAIDWSKPKEDSPYRDAYIGYENLRRKTFEMAESRSPGSVGELMLRLVDRRPSGLRYPIGPDARATVLAARLVSPNLFHRIATFVLNRLQRRDLTPH